MKKEKSLKLSESFTLVKRNVSRYDWDGNTSRFTIVYVDGRHETLGKVESEALADHYDLALDIK